MGVTVNIIDSWEPFKAAKKALSNTIDSKHITKLNILNNYGNNMCRMQVIILITFNSKNTKKLSLVYYNYFNYLICYL